MPRPTNDLLGLQLSHDITKNHIRALASLYPKKILILIILEWRNLARDNDCTRWTLDEIQTDILKEIGVWIIYY